MKALIIGATGATGKDLVTILLADVNYTQVVIFVRRATGLVHTKLVEVITDFNKLEDIAAFVYGDVWFCCIGTTMKAAGSKEQQAHVDYEIPATFADLAKKNNVSKAVLLSAYGASPTSRVFYSRIKGKLEAHIDSLGFHRFIIFQPGLLLRKDTNRTGEKITAAVLNILNAVGLFKKFRPLPTFLLAQKIAAAAKINASGKQVIALDAIFSV